MVSNDFSDAFNSKGFLEANKSQKVFQFNIASLKFN